jgi:ADP-heptose:LPS heptosyltransferase
VALARGLAQDADAHVLVTWGPGEEAAARAIVDGAPAAVLAPPTDLDALLALLRRASVVVAADTGPLHMAAALGTPCVGLYGPTSATRNGPYGAGHRALASPDGTMAALTPASVLAAVSEALP